jgi:hypothetical protein
MSDISTQLTLRELVVRLLTAGNHLTVALSDLSKGWQDWTREEALRRYVGRWQYDVLIACRTAMDVSAEYRKGGY